MPSFHASTFFRICPVVGGVSLHIFPLPATRWWDLNSLHRGSPGRSASYTTLSRCGAREILDGQRMDDASVWADDIKNYTPFTMPTRSTMLNIPLETNTYIPSQHRPKGLCGSLPRSSMIGWC